MSLSSSISRKREMMWKVGLLLVLLTSAIRGQGESVGSAPLLQVQQNLAFGPFSSKTINTMFSFTIYKYSSDSLREAPVHIPREQ